MYMGATFVRRSPLAAKVAMKAAEIENLKRVAEESNRVEQDKYRRELEAKVAFLERKLAQAEFDRASISGVRGQVGRALAAACRFYGIKQELVVTDSRISEHVRVRHLAMYVAHEYLGCSLPHIGAVLKRDHTTVLNGVRNIQKRLKDGDEAVSSALRSVLTMLDGSSPPDDGNYWGA